MEMPQNDFDRILFFELARKTCEAAYDKNPLDADNLTRWGGALLELSQCQSGAECTRMLEDAISKLEEAILVNPRKHDALWCLGNAETTRGFYTPDITQANIYFDKAADCFKQAVEEEPDNDLYVKSLELSSKAPELHQEVQMQIAAQQESIGAASTSNVKSSKKKQASTQRQKKNNQLTYDILGWVILAAGIFAWVGLTKSQGPPPPPSW